jgi:hypothetical protein
MNSEMLIRTTMLRSPGFSRIRLARQYAAIPVGIPPAKAGTPGWHIWTIFEKFISRDSRSFHIQAIYSKFISRDSCSQLTEARYTPD